MLTIDGIVSGFDTTGLINAVIAAQAAPVATMRDQVTALEDKKDKIAGMSNRLTDLAETMGTLRDDALRAFTATPSDEGLSVSVTSEAAAGTYSVDIQTLGQAEVSSSTASFADTNLGSLDRGTLEITYQGETHTITIDDTNDGLSAVAAELDDIEGLQAYTLDTGTGTDPYKLVVKGEIGAANTIDFAFTPDGGATGTALAFQEDVGALDTVAEIDGQTVYIAGSTIDAIPGLTIDASQTTDGPAIVTVDEDLEATTAKLQELVDAYNEVRDYYQQNTLFNEEEGIQGALVGESGARRVMDSLATMVTQQYANDGQFEALSQLGISTQRDGTLELDTEAFQEAWTENRADVEALFFADTGPLAEIQTRIEDVFVDSEGGTLESRSDSIQGSIEDLEETIARKEDFLASYADRLRDQFNAMETALAQSQSTSSYLAALTVQSSSGGGSGLF